MAKQEQGREKRWKTERNERKRDKRINLYGTMERIKYIKNYTMEL